MYTPGPWVYCVWRLRCCALCPLVSGVSNLSALPFLAFPTCFEGTRGNGRVGKMWPDRERVGTKTGIPSVLRSRPRLPDPFPTSVSVPAVHRPNLRLHVPVPAVSRPPVKVYSRRFPSRCPSSCSHPIPAFAHDFSHPARHISGRDVPIPITIYHGL